MAQSVLSENVVIACAILLSILIVGILLLQRLRSAATVKSKTLADKSSPKSLESATPTASSRSPSLARAPAAIIKISDKPSKLSLATLHRSRSASSPLSAIPSSAASSATSPKKFELVLPFEQSESPVSATPPVKTRKASHLKIASDVSPNRPHPPTSLHSPDVIESPSVARKQYLSTTLQSATLHSRKSSQVALPLQREGSKSSISELPNELEGFDAQGMATVLQLSPAAATAEGLYQLKSTGKVLMILKEMDFEYAQAVLKNLQQFSSKDYLFKILKRIIRELEDVGVEEAENLQLVEAFTLLHAIWRGSSSRP